jgi:hypothetical protein
MKNYSRFRVKLSVISSEDLGEATKLRGRDPGFAAAG